MPTINPLSLLLTIIGGLTVAALLGWIRKPRLVALVPRTFSYSHITDKGQLVEITIFNRGFKTEESVDVTLNPSYSYEMLGSNSQDASTDQNRIKISRIGPSDEVTALIIVEGGVFKKDDIVQILSKETKGSTVSKLEEVPPTGPQRVGLIAFFVAVPVALYVAYLSLDYIVKNFEPPSALVPKAKKTLINGWSVPSFNLTTSPKMLEAFESGKISAPIGTPSAKGDIVILPVSVSNGTDKIIKYTLSMTTIASEKKIPSYNRHLSDVIVIPGKSEERKISVAIPAKSENIAERTIFIEVSFESMDGNESLRGLTQQYIYK
nr:hypothetical protein [uncultured Rhodoferax sp.]